MLILAVLLCNLSFYHSQVDASKKSKAKKLIKSVVKGYVWQSLSTKKNFLPLPVPIPGKWQNLFDLMEKQQNTHRAQLGSSQAQKLSSLSSPEKSLLEDLLLISRPIQQAGSSSASLTGGNGLDHLATLGSRLDLNSLKKYSRIAAARYAARLVASQNNAAPNKQTGLSSIGNNQGNKLAQLFGNLAALASTSGGKLASTSAASQPTASLSQRKGLSGVQNDALVTLFNLIKLFQQLRQLDHAKLFNLAKKSTSLKDNLKQFPASVLTMNINNRKSFINKMNYIHKLTLDSNHRHRLNRAGNNAL